MSRFTVLPLVGLCLALVGLASYIAVRNYRAARWLVERAAPSEALRPGAAGGRQGGPMPPDAVQSAPVQTGSVQTVSIQTVSISAAGGRLAGWYVPSRNGAAVVVLHGSHSDRGSMIDEVRLLAAGGFGVLAFDWPGCGESEGSIDWGAPARAALGSALDWLGAQAGVERGRIGGLGFSLGGVILTQVAAGDGRLRAVVLESPASDFDSYVAFHYSKYGALSRWAARYALRDSGLLVPEESAVRNIARIAPRPVFLIGQSGDMNVPVAMAHALEQAAREPKQLWVIDGARHGGYLEVAGEDYSRKLLEFFDMNLAAPRR